ncbi:MAG: type II toxin-antitoxin system RelE/ParE family toxin [Phaeodactylibacter sp.]|uniref:type II toxin-antitoxin system RelE/ParE family toxin n=1 Tax=Phaeodactylibacter sp. TaxID=1940289 RepID=UPI0032EF9432
MKIKFTRNSERRLIQIRDYHASQGNPKKGVKIIKAVRKGTERLKGHPMLGQEEERLKHFGKGHRYILVEKKIKVIYRAAKHIIFVTDVFDTRQDPDKMRP